MGRSKKSGNKENPPNKSRTRKNTNTNTNTMSKTSPRERKKVQDKLEKYRERFRILYEKMVSGKYPIDEIRGFLKTNKEFVDALILVDESNRPISKESYQEHRLNRSFNQSFSPTVEFAPMLSVLFPILKNSESRQEVANMFIQKKGNLNLLNHKKERSALYEAVILGDKELIQMLMSHGASIDSFNFIQRDHYRTVIGNHPNEMNIPFMIPTKRTKKNKVSPDVDSNPHVRPHVSPHESPPVNTKKKQLDYDSPLAYRSTEEPEFWKSLFLKNEMFQWREQLHQMMRQDCVQVERGWNTKWDLCSMNKRMIPTYHIPEYKRFIDDPRAGVIQVDPKDFTYYNVVLCASLIVAGVISHKMKEQDYELVLKGGKAIQMVLTEMGQQSIYETEDIDILIRPKKGYQREEIKQLAGHVAHLIHWFIDIPDERMNCRTSIQTPEDPYANPDLYKLSYMETAGQGPRSRQKFKAIADIDFKKIPEDIEPYYEDLRYFTTDIPELGQSVSFVYPNIEAQLDEKLYYFSKFETFFRRDGPIEEPGYEKLTKRDYKRFMDKFKRAILVLNKVWCQKHAIDEKDSIRSRISKLPKDYDGVRILGSLYD